MHNQWFELHKHNNLYLITGQKSIWIAESLIVRHHEEDKRNLCLKHVISISINISNA